MEMHCLYCGPLNTWIILLDFANMIKNNDFFPFVISCYHSVVQPSPKFTLNTHVAG